MTEAFERIAEEVRTTREETLAEKTRAIARTFIRARILRYGSAFVAQNAHESFAEFLEQQTKSADEHACEKGVVGEIADGLLKRGVGVSYDELIAQVDKNYTEGGLEKVAEYMYTWADILYGNEEGTPTVVYNHSVEHNEKYSFFSECTNYDPDGVFMQVHLKPKYLYTGESYAVQIKNDMGEVARSIVQEHPETQAVVGESWLLDTPIARKMKFTMVPGYENTSDNSAWRMQLIKENGAIDPVGLRAYIEGGDLPYKVRCGHIPVKDFLYEYLPDELRHKPVVLRTIDLEQQETVACIENERERFKKILAETWDNVVDGSVSVQDLVDKIAHEAPYFFDFIRENKILPILQSILTEMCERSMAFSEVDHLEARHPDLAKRIALFREKEKDALRRCTYREELFDLQTHAPTNASRGILVSKKSDV